MPHFKTSEMAAARSHWSLLMSPIFSTTWSNWLGSQNSACCYKEWSRRNIFMPMWTCVLWLLQNGLRASKFQTFSGCWMLSTHILVTRPLQISWLWPCYRTGLGKRHPRATLERFIALFHCSTIALFSTFQYAIEKAPCIVTASISSLTTGLYSCAICFCRLVSGSLNRHYDTVSLYTKPH